MYQPDGYSEDCQRNTKLTPVHEEDEWEMKQENPPYFGDQRLHPKKKTLECLEELTNPKRKARAVEQNARQ